MIRETREHFEREYGCTAAEWLAWMPGATGGAPTRAPAPGTLEVDIGMGLLRLRWESLAPRRIALMVLPRLRVQFAFEGVTEAERLVFLRHFDLQLQRGGG
jgi:hypothetical protein